MQDESFLSRAVCSKGLHRITDVTLLTKPHRTIIVLLQVVMILHAVWLFFLDAVNRALC